MNESAPENESIDPVSDDDGVELSLDELGRAYAKAVGIIPDEPVISEPEPDEAPEDDDDACELSPRSILEAIMFVGSPDDDSPLTTRKIASWIRDVSPKEITRLAKELQAEYEKEGSAFRVERDKNQLRLVLAEEFEVIRQNFYGEVRAARLSQQAIDVMAIVAYNQPVTRDRVTELRGRDCSGVLNQLVKRNLVSAEQRESQPKVKEYRTTDRFLELFGLDTLDDLPQAEEIAPVEADD